MANNMAKLMQGRGWSYEELARRSDVSKATLCRVANGRNQPGLRTAQRIAFAFGVQIADVFPLLAGTPGDVA